ncbi:MAG: OmpH family outer membrane protein [Alphaproteobacteria bacterium]
MFLTLRPIRTATVILIAVGLWFTSVSNTAHAKGAKVAVVDRNLITRDSKAAKWMRSLIDRKYQLYQAEIKDAQNALESARDELKRQSPNLNADLIDKRRAKIRQQATTLSRVLQARKKELDQMFNNGMGQIEFALNEILETLARERSINMIINATKSQRIVLFIDKNLVLTEEALKRLNQRLPKVVLPKQPGPTNGR